MIRLPRSLYARMLVLSGIATLMALALAAWTIGGVLERFVTEGLDRRLDAEVALLATTVDGAGRIDRALLDQRRAALEDAPGWRWRIEAPGGAIGSADFPRLDPGPRRPRGHDVGERRDEGDARLRSRDGEGDSDVHARTVTLRTRGGPVTLAVAAPRDVIRRPIRGAVTPLLAALAMLALIMGGAALLQLRLGLKPLARLRDEVAAIRRGARDRVSEDQPTELQPLAAELNALTLANAATLATARQSAANLAHALKTPVATLALDMRDDPPRAAQVARIDATIRHHLARARAETANARSSTALAPAVADLAVAVRRLHHARGIAIDADVPAGLTVAVDAHDLDELVGNLLDNAARHARAIVQLSATTAADGRSVRIAIADDGPGLSAADRATATRPGTRLDERGDGHGFGLSIVTDLAALYGGSLLLEDAPGGGLSAVLVLPAGRA